MNIIYFGKPYSFTHVVSLRRFGSVNNFISKESINEVIESVNNKPGSIGVVPIENTTGGTIFDTVDILTLPKYLNSDLTIIEELELHPRLFLLSKTKIPLVKIKAIYSHEFALKRSELWAKKNISENIKLISVASTSESISRIKNNKYTCAIASEEAAGYYKLVKLHEIKAGGKKYLTRFFVIGKNEKTNKKI